MIGKLLAMFVGNRIDRADGEGGIKGAVLGLVAARVLRSRFSPIAWVVLAIVALWKLLFGCGRHRPARR